MGLVVHSGQEGFGDSEVNELVASAAGLGRSLYKDAVLLNVLKSACSLKEEIVAKHLYDDGFLSEEVKAETPFSIVLVLGLGDALSVEKLLEKIKSGNSAGYERTYNDLSISLVEVKAAIAENPDIPNHELAPFVRKAIFEVQEPWEKKFNKLVDAGMMQWFIEDGGDARTALESKDEGGKEEPPKEDKNPPTGGEDKK